MKSRKTTIVKLIVPAVLLTVLLVMYINQTEVNQNQKMKLEAVAGAGLYQIWDNYNQIAELPSELADIVDLKLVKEHLIAVRAYSDTVDHITNSDLLLPISSSLMALSDRLPTQSNQLTSEDQELYTMPRNKITELIPLISAVYYVPESQEGAKVTLRLNDEKSELIELRDELKDIAGN